MEKGHGQSGWAGTPGKPVRAGTAEAQLHLPGHWHRLFQGGLGAVPGWKPSWKVMPGPGSCPSPQVGVGAQDPRFVALSPEVPSSVPGLACLEAAPPFPCAPAAQPALLPAPAWEAQPPRDAPPRLSEAQNRLCGCFSVLPPPQRAPPCSGAHPSCHVVGGVPSSTAAATPAWFAHGQPKMEGKGPLARFGNSQSSTRLTNCQALQCGHPAPCSHAGRATSSASCERPGTVGRLVPLLLTGQSLRGPRGAMGRSLYDAPAPW